MANRKPSHDSKEALIGRLMLAMRRSSAAGVLHGQAIAKRVGVNSSDLECLDLTHNYLTKDGINAVKGICKKVVTEDQQKADDWGDGELHYYCAITE